MDSQYSQLPNFSTQQSQFSSEVCDQVNVEVSEKKKIRGAGFNKDEDRLLVSAWLNTSMDAIHGNEQKHQTFWARIGDYYNQNKWFKSSRTDRMLSQRWQKIQKEVNRFSGCIATINERNQSGKTEQDKIADAKATYEAIYKAKFNLDHAWILLRHQPKWLQTQESVSKKRENQSDFTSFSSSSTERTPIDVDQDNTNDTYASTKRPLGKKAEKRKMKETTSDEPTPILVQIQTLHEEKKERDERKMELIKKKVEQDEKKLRLKQMEFETKIMSIDTSGMCDEERLYYTQLRMKILRGDGL
ncbi:unnamed protein product [Prunus brigantina]